MNPPSDNYPFILRKAAEAYLADGLESGRMVLLPIAMEVWPGMPPGSVHRRPHVEDTQRATGRRAFSLHRSAATFRRDYFRCRYCGAEIIPKPIAVLMHWLYPRELPFHPNYKAGCMHPLFWTRVAEADHLVAGSVGGAWTDPDNHVTACVCCNTRKGNASIEEIGWKLMDPTPGWDGLVPIYQRIWEHAGRPEPTFHQRWLRALDAIA
jgi:5-methylcytosine-specific restriction endonuclease McrA